MTIYERLEKTLGGLRIKKTVTQKDDTYILKTDIYLTENENKKREQTLGRKMNTITKTKIITKEDVEKLKRGGIV